MKDEIARKATNKYLTLFHSIDQGYAVCELVRNKEGKGVDYYLLELNPTFEKQTGIGMEMLLGKTILEAVPGLDPWWINTYAAVVDKQEPVLFEHYFENNERWYAIEAHPLENNQFVLLYKDITDRKKAEEALRSSEKRFRTLAESLPLIVSLAQPDGAIEYINNWWTEFSGHSSDQFINGEWLSAIHPDDRETVLQSWQKALAEHEAYQYEFRALAKDGNYHWLLLQGVPLKNEIGEVYKWINIATDIQDRKKGKEQIKQFASSRKKNKT